MTDEDILELFWKRIERALSECRRKYGAYVRTAAMNILGSREDAREVENDVYLDAWNTIPPRRPLPLAPYLGMLSRRGAIDRLRADSRRKRGSGQYRLTLDELRECAGDDGRALDDRLALRQTLDAFLSGLSERDRDIFLRRYWWVCPIREIARDTRQGESAVKTALYRMRQKLRKTLEQEGLL